MSAEADRSLPPGHLALVLAICAAWGANFLAAAVALRHFPPFLCTGLRLALVLACLAPALRPVPAGQRARLAAIAVLNGAAHFGLVFCALRAAGDLSSIAIALQSYVPMSAVLSAILLGERIEGRTALGIVVAFGGVLVLGFDPVVLSVPLALLLTLASAFSLALGTTLMRGLQGVTALGLQAWTAVIGCPVLLLASALTERDQLAAVASARWTHWAGVAYTGLVASVVGQGLLFWLVQRHPVHRVTPYLLVAPVLAMALGVLVWGDRPGPKLLLGAALVLGGVLTIAVRRR